jgi:hypothetical protein
MASNPLGPVVRHLRRLAGPVHGGPDSDAALPASYAQHHDGEAFAVIVLRQQP